ncbi:hypothetical protein GCM10025793_17720 [Lysobacter lycopersici]
MLQGQDALAFSGLADLGVVAVLLGLRALLGDAALTLHFREAHLLALAVLRIGTRALFVRTLAGIGGTAGGFLLLRHHRTLLRLLALGLFARMLLLCRQLLLPAGLLFAGLLARMLLLCRQLLLPVGLLFAGLLPLLFDPLLLRARAVAVLLALLFLHALLRLLPLLLGALARVVGGVRGGAMRRRGGRIGAGSGPGRLLRGRVRLRFGLVVAVLRILALRLRRFACDGLPGESDREACADEAGQDVLAQGLHVALSRSRQRPHGRSRRRGRLTISENRHRRARRSARVKPRSPG